MNLKKLSVAALAALTLFSCTKEVIVEKEGPGTTEEGTVQLNFALDLGDFGTKAESNHYDDYPTEQERKIYNYAVLVFNSQRVLEATLVASPYSPSAGVTQPKTYPDDYAATDNRLTFDSPVTVSAGAKYIFTIINAPTSLLETQEELEESVNRLTDLSTWTLDVENTITTIAGNNTLPAEKNRGFMMTNKIGLDSHYFNASDEVETVYLEVGRAMAKASLASELELGAQAHGDLIDVEYKIVNNPTEMYVIPNTRISGGSYIFVTPYFEQYSDNSVNGSTKYFESGTYKDASTATAKTHFYVMENANKTPKWGNSAVAFIKGKYVPYQLLDASGDPTTAGGNWDGTFYRIYEEIGGEKVFEDEYYLEVPAVTGSQAVLPYPQGITYYRLALKNSASSEPAPYTVKRNSYYKIDLISVYHAGDSDEDDLIPDPDEPIEGEANINARIRIVDWDSIDQKGEL